MRPFIVKHYSSDERPIIKGNGFDGLEVGESREEAQEFIAFVNKLICDNADSQTAKQKFDEFGGSEEPDPLERLRFFCSLAMKNQDWLDVEPFFYDVLVELKSDLK